MKSCVSLKSNGRVEFRIVQNFRSMSVWPPFASPYASSGFAKGFGQGLSQSHKLTNSSRPLDNQTWQSNGWPQHKLPKFGFRTHTTALWQMEQSSILSAKFDCVLARQKFLLLATAHDCQTGLYNKKATIVCLLK